MATQRSEPNQHNARAPLCATQAAYIAGLMDSDGHIGIVRRTSIGSGRLHYRALAQFGQTKPIVPMWLLNVVGGGAVHEHRQRKFHNIVFHATTMRWMLPQILPYLILKRRQCELAMEFLAISSTGRNGHALSDEEIARREALRFECEMLNKKNPSQNKTPEEIAADPRSQRLQVVSK